MRRKSNHSFVVNILAQALYELFAANDGQYPRTVSTVSSFSTFWLHIQGTKAVVGFSPQNRSSQKPERRVLPVFPVGR